VEWGDPGPGSHQLIDLIRKVGGEHLIADFEQYTRYHFGDVLKDGSGLTPRLALILINQLPIESRTMAVLQGGAEFIGWDRKMYMLANLIDATNQVAYVTVAAASGKKKPKKPTPIERPGMAVNRKRGKNSFSSVAQNMMARVKARKGK